MTEDVVTPTLRRCTDTECIAGLHPSLTNRWCSARGHPAATPAHRSTWLPCESHFQDEAGADAEHFTHPHGQRKYKHSSRAPQAALIFVYTTADRAVDREFRWCIKHDRGHSIGTYLSIILRTHDSGPTGLITPGRAPNTTAVGTERQARTCPYSRTRQQIATGY
jgi:hypothetical protein